MVIPSSIPTSATQMLDVELSPNEGFEEFLEDSDDKPIIKTRISDFDDTFDEELDIGAMVMHFLPLLLLLFLLFLSFFCASLTCLACYLIMQS